MVVVEKGLFVDDGHVMFLANDLLHNTNSCQWYVIVMCMAQFIWRSKLWQNGTTSIILATVGHAFMNCHTFVIFLMSWVSGYTSPLVHSLCSCPINLSSISSFLNMIYSSALCLLHCVYRSYQVNQGSVIKSNHMLFTLFLIYKGYWFTVLKSLDR